MQFNGSYLKVMDLPFSSLNVFCKFDFFLLFRFESHYLCMQEKERVFFSFPLFGSLETGCRGVWG